VRAPREWAAALSPAGLGNLTQAGETARPPFHIV
jgi:hypothetical protein